MFTFRSDFKRMAVRQKPLLSMTDDELAKHGYNRDALVRSYVLGFAY
ncbi:MAG: hypothetical protein AAF667_11125 [Pseudomonadota bacterium]